MAKSPVIIIGAGPAGLTAGYELALAGKEVEIIEAAPTVGGLCQSFKLWDCTVDLGPHRFFSMDPRVNLVWMEMAGEDYRMVHRQTRIFYDGKLYDYPLKPLNALGNMGAISAATCMTSYGWTKVTDFFSSEPKDSFESLIKSRFGSRLYEIFFKSYTEKLWGIPCSELSSDFALQRIKNFSLGEAIKSFFACGGKKHRTLADEFAYPVRGAGQIYQTMAERFQSLGGKLRLNSRVKRVRAPRGGTVSVELEDGAILECDKLVSSMPLTLLVKGLDDLPAEVAEATERLKYRNTVLIYLKVDSTSLFSDQWIYVQSPELRVGRITNFRNWVPSLHGDASFSILCLEMWVNDEDELWKANDETFIDMAKADMEKSGLCSIKDISDGKVIRIHRSYPIYSRNYKADVQIVAKHLESLGNMIAIGRYGAFKYNNQDHSILMGLLAAENILGKGKHNLWDVNSDTETYQEGKAPKH